jgi:hypothetical protein
VLWDVGWVTAAPQGGDSQSSHPQLFGEETGQMPSDSDLFLNVLRVELNKQTHIFNPLVLKLFLVRILHLCQSDFHLRHNKTGDNEFQGLCKVVKYCLKALTTKKTG